MAKCEHLSDLAIQLAEAAHAQALLDAQPPPPRPTVGLPANPGFYWPPGRPAFERTTAAHLFDDFSRCARQALLLEARLDTDTFQHPNPVVTERPGLPEHSVVAEQAGQKPQDPNVTPPGPRIPNDETRLHHEQLEDDLAGDARRAPEDILAAIENTLHTAQQTARTNLHAAPPPSPPIPSPPSPAPASRATAPIAPAPPAPKRPERARPHIQARARASPAR